MYLYNDIQIKPLFGEVFPWEVEERKKKEEKKEEKKEVDLEKIKKEAYLQGVKEGFERGRNSAEKEADERIRKLEEDYKKEIQKIKAQIIEKLEKVIDEISSLRKNIILKAEEDIRELSLLIAKKVIKKEASESSEVVLNNIISALENTPIKDKIIVKLNPEDYSVLSGMKELRDILGVKEIILKKDENISKGGCIVETEFCEISATLESQFKIIEDAIKGND